jgi:hypothetical protein
MENLWVELKGNIIIARLRGVPSQEILKKCQETIFQIAHDTGSRLILYDALEMSPPAIDLVISQWNVAEIDALNELKLKRAILVTDTKLAYLARLAFGDGVYRVFYNDLSAAVTWLIADSNC